MFKKEDADEEYFKKTTGNKFHNLIQEDSEQMDGIDEQTSGRNLSQVKVQLDKKSFTESAYGEPEVVKEARSLSRGAEKYSSVGEVGEDGERVPTIGLGKREDTDTGSDDESIDPAETEFKAKNVHIQDIARIPEVQLIQLIRIANREAGRGRAKFKELETMEEQFATLQAYVNAPSQMDPVEAVLEMIFERSLSKKDEEDEIPTVNLKLGYILILTARCSNPNLLGKILEFLKEYSTMFEQLDFDDLQQLLEEDQIHKLQNLIQDFLIENSHFSTYALMYCLKVRNLLCICEVMTIGVRLRINIYLEKSMLEKLVGESDMDYILKTIELLVQGEAYIKDSHEQILFKRAIVNHVQANTNINMDETFIIQNQISHCVGNFKQLQLQQSAAKLKPQLQTTSEIKTSYSQVEDDQFEYNPMDKVVDTNTRVKFDLEGTPPQNEESKGKNKFVGLASLRLKRDVAHVSNTHSHQQLNILQPSDMCDIIIENQSIDYKAKSYLLFSLVNKHTVLQVLQIVLFYKQSNLLRHLLRSIDDDILLKIFHKFLYSAMKIDIKEAIFIFTNYRYLIEECQEKALQSVIDVIRDDVSFLEEKLYVMLHLIQVIDYTQAVQVLKVFKEKFVDEPDPAKNLLFNTPNPIKLVVYMMLVLKQLSKKFQFAHQSIEDLNEKLVEFANSILSESKNVVDLLLMIEEKVYFKGRRVLSTIALADMNELLTTYQMQNVVQNCWTGPYDRSESFMEENLGYRILDAVLIDNTQRYVTNLELENTFDIQKRKQINRTHWLQYKSWLASIDLKFLIEVIFVVYMAIHMQVFAIAVVDGIEKVEPQFQEIQDVKTQIANGTYTKDQGTKIINGHIQHVFEDADEIYTALRSLLILNYIASLYLVKNILEKTASLMRNTTVPLFTIEFCMNLVGTAVTIYWTASHNKAHANHVGYVNHVDEVQAVYKMIHVNDYQIYYIVSTLIAFQWCRVLFSLKGTRTMGPMLKIIRSMLGDILKFMFMYLIIFFLFSCIANILFNELPEYDTMSTTLLNLYSSSLGGFDFAHFDNIEKINKNVAIIFLIVYLIISNILLLNLLIAILSNTYDMFTEKSTSLYLREIALIRQRLDCHRIYGCLVSVAPPFNIFIIPFVPFVLIFRSEKLNNFLLKMEYIPVLVMSTALFFAISIVLSPLAYFVAIFNKTRLVFKRSRQSKLGVSMAVNFGSFIAFGFFKIFAACFLDTYFYMVNLYSNELKERNSALKKKHLDPIVLKILRAYLLYFIDRRRNVVRARELISKIQEAMMISSQISQVLYGKDIDPQDCPNVIFRSSEDFKQFIIRSPPRRVMSQFSRIKTFILENSYPYSEDHDVVNITSLYSIIEEIKIRPEIKAIIKNVRKDFDRSVTKEGSSMEDEHDDTNMLDQTLFTDSEQSEMLSILSLKKNYQSLKHEN